MIPDKHNHSISTYRAEVTPYGASGMQKGWESGENPKQDTRAGHPPSGKRREGNSHPLHLINKIFL